MKKVFSCLLAPLLFNVLCKAQSSAAIVTIQSDSAHLCNTFVPAQALGAGIDGHEAGDNNRIFQPANIRAMLSVSFRPVTYRLRTELGNEVWHWNPKGTWSEGKKKQGYWTSATDLSSTISLSYGYRLPRRGNSVDQANNDGYSRITDGDKNSFWKSSPYLDSHFTGEADSLHSQWVIVDLGREELVDAIWILWGMPYATRFSIEYANKALYDYFDNAGYFDIDSAGLWNPFPNHQINNSKGGVQTIQLSAQPITVRFLRLRLYESSHRVKKKTIDIRDRLGYAIKELFVGRLVNGKLIDLVTHSPKATRQSQVYVSSTDPWHRISDIDSLTEQIGIDRFYQCGITGGVPALLSTGLLYDTPENAKGLLEYVVNKNYSVAGVELGEEPDGQMINAIDGAELYRQWSRAIKTTQPAITLGGPSLQGIILDRAGELLPTKKWMQGYLSYLQKRDALQDFRFFSFEWYPYDSVCAASAPQLAHHPYLLDKAMTDMQSISALKGLPFYITEYGYSAFAGLSEVSIQAALMNADIVGKFLSKGGSRAFLYGWEPNELQSDFGCAPGNNMLFGMNDEGKIIYRTAAYYGAQMVRQWTQPFNQSLNVYTATSDVKTAKGEDLISSYALRLPDGSWSVLLINKDSANSYPVILNLMDEKSTTSLPFPYSVYQYSGEQYQWKNDGVNGHPLRELPPLQKTVSQNEKLFLPPYSLTVVRSSK